MKRQELHVGILRASWWPKIIVLLWYCRMICDVRNGPGCPIPHCRRCTKWECGHMHDAHQPHLPEASLAHCGIPSKVLHGFFQDGKKKQLPPQARPWLLTQGNQFGWGSLHVEQWYYYYTEMMYNANWEEKLIHRHFLSMTEPSTRFGLVAWIRPGRFRLLCVRKPKEHRSVHILLSP